MRKNYLNAHGFLLAGIVVTVIGVLIGGAFIFPNWQSHAELEANFSRYDSAEYTEYANCKSDSLIVVQTSGNSSCKYNIYQQKRGSSSLSYVTGSLTFPRNDEWNGKTYSLSSSWWKDVRFKVNKTNGTNVASKLVLSLGKED